MALTALPPPPDPNNPTTFAGLAETWNDAIYVFSQELEDSLDAITSLITATSTTSLMVGAGTKSPNVGPGKGFAPGQSVVVARTSAPATTRMVGIVLAYDSGTGILDVDVAAGGVFGSGTYTDWSISSAPGVSAGGWTQIATTTISSPQAAVDFASIPLSYGTLVLIYNGASHNDAGSPALQVQFSNDNGATKTTAINIGAGVGGAFPIGGGLQVVGYAKDFAFANPSFTMTAASLGAQSGTPTVNSIAIKATGGINFLRLAYSAGSFDAGTFTLYGV